jgi:CheY-like chemotaxis protein
MDGYAASRAIRTWEDSLCDPTHVPIVALTANALVGDAELCLAAGMDDHLAKPYTRQQLAGVLARWLSPDQVLPGSDEPVDDVTSSAVEDAAPLLDSAALENIRSIDDDGTVLAEVIQMFQEEAPAHLAGLQAAVNASQAASLGSIAHALKSASFNIGAMALGETCRRLERLGKAGDLGGAPELVASIERQLLQLEPVLNEQRQLCGGYA